MSSCPPNPAFFNGSDGVWEAVSAPRALEMLRAHPSVLWSVCGSGAEFQLFPTVKKWEQPFPGLGCRNSGQHWDVLPCSSLVLTAVCEGPALLVQEYWVYLCWKEGCVQDLMGVRSHCGFQ